MATDAEQESEEEPEPMEVDGEPVTQPEDAEEDGGALGFVVVIGALALLAALAGNDNAR